MAEEKRIVTDERRYAIMSRESIKLMADAAGHEETSDSVAGILGEDVSYRLREITQKSAQFMRHARRKRMNTDDFNKACGFSDIQPVLGHGSQEAVHSFQAVKVEQGEPIHFALDPTLNLATEASSTFIPKHSGETTIKAHWLVVEGVQKSTQNPQGTPGNKVEPGGPLMKYFDKITQAVLGNDEEMMKTALSDLRTNGNISPLLPHFVSFISNGVKTLGDDVCKLTRLLSMVQSLVYNSSLFLEAQPFLAVMSQSVQYCLLDPLVSSGQSCPTDDHWVLRDYAARVLAHIVGIWGNSVNHLERYTEKTLREALHDLSRPFACHYGAVMGLMYLGTEFREENITDATNNGEAKKVFKTISDYDTKFSKRPSFNGFLSAFHKSPVSFYFEMFEYFGDALTLRLPEIAELKSHVFKPKERDLVTSISDPTADKSGEELLKIKERDRNEENPGRKRKHNSPSPDVDFSQFLGGDSWTVTK
ncbi:TAF6L-like protein [Mya arenaria]|uniref:Histone H4 n=1 Tax=Mya arenaria TaxID=6604 RepID=A0ABY7FH90_MYAAR|nr:TAF6L-like protein [Mya arenaria]